MTFATACDDTGISPDLEVTSMSSSIGGTEARARLSYSLTINNNSDSDILVLRVIPKIINSGQQVQADFNINQYVGAREFLSINNVMEMDTSGLTKEEISEYLAITGIIITSEKVLKIPGSQ